MWRDQYDPKHSKDRKHQDATSAEMASSQRVVTHGAALNDLIHSDLCHITMAPPMATGSYVT